MKHARFALTVAVVLAGTASSAADKAVDLANYRGTVSPFFQAHCHACHSGKQAEAKLSLAELPPTFGNDQQIKTWKNVVAKLILHEMPPSDEPQPDAVQVRKVIRWIKAELAKQGHDVKEFEQKLQLPQHGNRVDHDALFNAGGKTLAASPARLWRRSPQIYQAFTDRVTKRRKEIAQAFSTSSGEGFKDYSELFAIDEPTIAQLMRNARAIVDFQFVSGGGVREFKAAASEPAPDKLTAALRREFQIVLQRDPGTEELRRFQALMAQNIKDAGAETGVKMTLATVFLLPEALYRVELGQGERDPHGRQMLAGRELAYAIGYALSDNGPDDKLLKAADAGQLVSRNDVQRELDRLLNDRKFDKPRIMRFFEEYFEFPAALDVFKDLKRGQWRPEILVSDTRYLIEYILEEDRDVLKQLLTTNKSFVNYRVDRKLGPQPARVANKPPKNATEAEKRKQNPKPRQMEYWDLYNLPEDWKFEPHQPIELPAEERAGILTQPSWLAAFSTNNENHAIRRGKWIRERLLGGVVPDVPITVDAQLPDEPHRTLRQRMEITRQEYCWKCHQKMNPLGLAFESYDYLGQFRRTEPVLDREATEKNVDQKGKPLGPVCREVPVDATGLVEDADEPAVEGTYKNAVQMIHKLADSPRVRQVFVRHAFRYWMGRNETLDDASTLVAADQAYVNSGGSIKALITSLLTSDSFLYRKSEPLTRTDAR